MNNSKELLKNYSKRQKYLLFSIIDAHDRIRNLAVLRQPLYLLVAALRRAADATKRQIFWSSV